MGTIDRSLLDRMDKSKDGRSPGDGGGNDNGGNGGHTGGHEPPGGNALEKRVEKLEDTIVDVQLKLIKIDTRLDPLATKADLVDLKAELFKAMNDQTWKFIAAATSMSALFAAIAFGLARVFK